MYSFLAAKDYTWTFVSGDSGSWLASANMWFVPQAFGSPLYISLAKIAGLLPFDLPATMAIMLSAIPAAVTVTFVYLILWKLTDKYWVSLAGAGILAVSAVFLSQATVVEEYALSTMFLTIAFWFYVLDRKQMMALFLGLGLAVHIIVLPIAVLWFALNWREWRAWLKTVPMFVLSGVCPYILILVLMASSAPPLFAGNGLSLQALNEYMGGTYVVGTLALAATPERLGMFLGILILSFGMAWLPIGRSLMGGKNKVIYMALATFAFPAWYYITCLHASTWTYLTWASPFLAILAGIGLSKLSFKHLQVAYMGIIMLLLLNLTTMNANIITNNEPVAETFVGEMMELPDGSAVIATRYAHRGFATYYAYSLGKDFIPLYYTSLDPRGDMLLYRQYAEWVNDKWGIAGNDVIEMARSALAQGRNVYIMEPRTEQELVIAYCFDWEKVEGQYFYRVTGVDNISIEEVMIEEEAS